MHNNNNPPPHTYTETPRPTGMAFDTNTTPPSLADIPIFALPCIPLYLVELYGGIAT